MAPVDRRRRNHHRPDAPAAYAHVRAHQRHLRHHKTASVRARYTTSRRTCRTVCGRAVDAVAGYPKNGFEGEKGERAIVDGTRLGVDVGGTADEGFSLRIWDTGSDADGDVMGGYGGGDADADDDGKDDDDDEGGDAGGGGGGGWCDGYGKRRASSI